MKSKSQSGNAKASGQQLGWGSNIESSRLARAAQLALQRGDHALALQDAERAAKSAPNNPELWFLVGYAARLNKVYGQSVDAYQKGLHIEPTSMNGMSGLAQTYSMMGRDAEAERLLTQVIAANPRQRDDLLILGNMKLQQGDYNDALNWLGKAEALGPDARTELLLALSYEHLKQMDQANHYLSLAKNRAPNNPDVQRSLAGYYRETGDLKDSLAELESIRNPPPDVIAELAYTYQLSGEPKKAAHLYGQAANAMPRNLDLQLSAAQAQIDVDSLNDAQPFLERAAGLNPDYYRLHAIRGVIAKTQGHDEVAAKEYTAALAGLPATPAEGPLYGVRLHLNLNEVYEELNDTERAQHQLQLAQTEIAGVHEQGADRAPFLRLRALIEMKMGHSDAALKDANASLALDPNDIDSQQLDGDLLMKLGRTQDAISVYRNILAKDPRNRFALTSIGYASRANGDNAAAEQYFEELAKDYPSVYVPYLALGDLFTAQGHYAKAEAEYKKGFALDPHNALILAGGMNAAIEAQKLDLAGQWLTHVTDNMDSVPQILREKERYFSFEGQYEKSAALGERAIKVLPKDRDVVVYLGYDYLRLEKYDELLALTTKYTPLLPREADLPLLAGYVYKHEGQREQAVKAFTEALDRDPDVVTAYVNRGYLLNDMRQPKPASADFEQAIKREPKDGQAHLGLAFSYLAMDQSDSAVKQSFLAAAILGDSKPVHVIRATAYGREGMFGKAATEYQAALKFTPDDGSLYLGLGHIYFSERRYRAAVDQLNSAQKYLQNDPELYALLARSYANLDERDLAMRNIHLAEDAAAKLPPGGPAGSQPSDIYIQTGEALSTLGEQDAAMERFSRALVAPGSNRVGVRLAIAELMMHAGHDPQAERQIALAQMEAEAGDTEPLTGNQYLEAASILQGMHEYELSETFLNHAERTGADNSDLHIAMANNYLALGETDRAAVTLAEVRKKDNNTPSYAYLLAEGSLYEQQHHNAQALSAFAEASNASGEDQTAEQAMLVAGGNEGLRLNRTISVMTGVLIEPIFEDSTVYVLDAKLDSPSGPVASTDFANLPPPRSSLQTESTTSYHLHLGQLPDAGGFFQLRDARGTISIPATHSIVDRNTIDTIFNFGVSPTVHVGSGLLTFDGGIQETIRRDTLVPTQLDQNLFRVFTYLSTSTFMNAISARGYFIHESGPFTQTPIQGSTLTGDIDFRVGAPWSKTALITGWASNDQMFTSKQFGNTENYFTTSYIGMTQQLGQHLSVEGIAEFVRSWRVVPYSPLHSAIAQALRPAGRIDFAPSRNWEVQATGAYESTRGFHAYDMTQNGFSVSYTRPFGRSFNDETGEVHVKYPIRFSAGLQEETFPNFSLGTNTVLRPYVSIHIF